MSDSRQRAVRRAFLVCAAVGLAAGYVALNGWVLFIRWAASTCVPIGLCS